MVRYGIEVFCITRRIFCKLAGYATFGWLMSLGAQGAKSSAADFSLGMRVQSGEGASARPVVLFLGGDVMTGRGIDQVLPNPSKPHIYEPYARSARAYVRLAEQAHGAISAPVSFPYVWGAALDEFAYYQPDVRVVNLETAVTTSEEWIAKGINYRMHPANIAAITAAKIDCCVLANNHVLDWGRSGLTETLVTLRDAGLRTAGAGDNAAAAAAPAVLAVRADARVLVFAFGLSSSGIPSDWAAGPDKPGVNLLPDLSKATLSRIAHGVRRAKRERDLVVASIHWGGNWGYDIPAIHRQFAHQLIDEAGVDVIHGHSSHHPLGIEVYKGRLIIYGCGDLLNDYEGIGGYRAFRGDLALMYFPSLHPVTGELLGCQMTLLEIRRFQLHRALAKDALWLCSVLNREGEKLGTSVASSEDNRLMLAW